MAASSEARYSAELAQLANLSMAVISFPLPLAPFLLPS